MTQPGNRPVAVVTGAAKRVGRAVALELASAGHDVVIHYNHSAAEAQHTVGEVSDRGARAIAVAADLADRGAAQHIINQTSECFGRLDVLVNNAAVFEPMPLEDFEIDTWQDTLLVNLAAPIKLCQLAAPIMKRQGRGCVINFCDSSIDRPWKSYLAYGPSKAGLAYVTKALARALAPMIRVNGVAPGIAVFPEHYTAGQRQRLVEGVPLMRQGTAEEMAQAVRFLVASAYITGQIINVDGGRSIT